MRQVLRKVVPAVLRELVRAAPPEMVRPTLPDGERAVLAGVVEPALQQPEPEQPGAEPLPLVLRSWRRGWRG